MKNNICILITFFENNIGGIIAGVSSSLIFLLALSRLKPKLKICDKIAIDPEDGIDHYGFKVINKSYFYRVYDMKAKLFEVEILPSENNEDFLLKEIDLRKSNHWFLNRFNPTHTWQDLICNEKKLKKRTDYSIQFFTKIDIKTLVESKKRIRFEVLARHSLSGFTVVKTQTFTHKNDFVNGSFLSGNTSKIKE